MTDEGKSNEEAVEMKVYTGGSDIGIIFRPTNGTWYIKGDGNNDWGKTMNNTAIQCGVNGDIPMLVDWYGDGKPKLTVYRPKNGNWYIKGLGHNNWSDTKSGNLVIQCGINGDIPVPCDYFSEGKPRFAVYRPSNGNWYIKGDGFNDWGKSSNNLVIQCGINGDIPLPFDYFGEGTPRIAVWRSNNGNWYIKGKGLNDWAKSVNNITIQCGCNGDIPIVKDYFGDGKYRISVWRPSNGNWYIKGYHTGNWSKNEDNIIIQCGINGDVPVPGDYFNQAKKRIAVWRPSNGVWYIKGDGTTDWEKSVNNTQIQCGVKGDIPLVTYVPLTNKFNSNAKFML